MNFDWVFNVFRWKNIHAFHGSRPCFFFIGNRPVIVVILLRNQLQFKDNFLHQKLQMFSSKIEKNLLKENICWNCTRKCGFNFTFDNLTWNQSIWFIRKPLKEIRREADWKIKWKWKWNRKTLTKKSDLHKIIWIPIDWKIASFFIIYLRLRLGTLMLVLI